MRGAIRLKTPNDLANSFGNGQATARNVSQNFESIAKLYWLATSASTDTLELPCKSWLKISWTAHFRLAVMALAPVFEGFRHHFTRNRVITLHQGCARSFIESGAVPLAALPKIEDIAARLISNNIGGFILISRIPLGQICRTAYRRIKRIAPGGYVIMSVGRMPYFFRG